MKSFVIVVGVVKFEEKFLLVKRNPEQKHNPNEWEFVSGKIESGELAEEAIIREVVEETGLEGEIIKSGEVLEWIEEGIRWIVVPYLINVLEHNVTLSKEHTEYEWKTRKEINDRYLETVLKTFNL